MKSAILRAYSATSLYLGLLLLLTALLYLPGSNGPFVLDDFSNIPKSFIGELSLDELIAASTANSSGPLKRPVAAFSFAINHYISGPDAKGFKIANIGHEFGTGRFG